MEEMKELIEKGALLTQNKDKSVLTLMKLDSVIEQDFIALHPEMTLGDMLKNGVSKSNRNLFPVIDEAQNLTSKQMKTLITRAGPGTKVVCLGNLSQIDTPYLSETTSGLTYVVDRFKEWPHSGHVTLRRGERSRLAEFASEAL